MAKSRRQQIFHRILFLFVLLTILISIGEAQSFKFRPTGRFILPPSLGKKLLTQCSRPVPTGITEFWQPSPKEIDELEASLGKYLDEREKARSPNPPIGATFRRQYVGFVGKVGSIHQGERFIYGNFYPDEARGDAPDSESKEPVGVCDGGPAFWGIVYRISRKTFEDLEFNGRG